MASAQQYDSIAGVNLHAASGGNPHLLNALTAMQRQMAILGGGSTPSTSLSTGLTQGVDPPVACPFTVIGQDGKWVIDITPPQGVVAPSQAIKNLTGKQNPASSTVLYQLQSADDEGMTLNLFVYDPTVETHIEIIQPNSLKFWQLRSQYANSPFSAWQPFSSAAVCGPVQVWSGLQRNISTTLNNAATTPQGTNPCTQSGTTTQINVAASVWKAGGQTINYNSGSVDPGSYGDWFIYASDKYRQGGTVTFLATADDSVITSDDSFIYFGLITTSSSGGGTGRGGGGGTCCRTGVPATMHDASLKDVSTVIVGDTLMGIDGGPEVVERVLIHPDRPCFHMEFDADGKLNTKQFLGNFTVYEFQLDRTHTYMVGQNGILDGAASDHTVQFARGGFTNVFAMVVGEDYNLINGAIGSHNYNKN